MAIDAYTGLPGHGKSYGVVEHVIIPSLKQNRLVVTNIPLEVDALLMTFGGRIEQLPEDWFERPDLGDLAPPGCVLVLDELWRRWPNGMKASEASTPDKALLAEHRHRVDAQGRSMRVILVTQDLDQLAKWARLLVETTYRMCKLSKKRFRVDIYRGSVGGPKPPKTQLLRQTAGSFKPEVYGYYKSATQSQTGDVGDESKADGRASILRSWGLWGLVSIVLLCGTLGIYGISRFFSTDRFEHAPAPAAAPVAKPVEAPAPAPSTASRAAQQVYNVKPEGPVMSITWRVAGYLHGINDEGKTAWKSIEGYNAQPKKRISQTSRVILQSVGNQTRLVPIAQCRFFEGTPDMYCDIDGERVTPWTGRGAVTSVIDPIASVSTGSANQAR